MSELGSLAGMLPDSLSKCPGFNSRQLRNIEDITPRLTQRLKILPGITLWGNNVGVKHKYVAGWQPTLPLLH